VHNTLDFADLLRLIDERSAASVPRSTPHRSPGRTSPLPPTTTPTEGRSWRNWLSADGARAARLTEPAAGEGPDVTRASARGTAGELLLALYGRLPLDSLALDGDRRLFDQLVDWDPER
jgi:hypothetical protein